MIRLTSKATARAFFALLCGGCLMAALSPDIWIGAASGPSARNATINTLKSNAASDGTASQPVEKTPSGLRSPFSALFTNLFNRTAFVPEPALPITTYSLSVTPNGYVKVTNSANIDIYGQTPFTVEAWIKPQPSSAGVTQAIVSHFGTTSSEGGYFMRLLTGKRLRFVVFRNINPTSTNVDSDILFPFDGQWHHVAGVYDPSAVGSQLRLYIDGQLHGSVSCNPGPNSTSAPLYIGISNDPASPQYFNGLIDEMRITRAAVYNANFNPNPHPDPISGTVALWHFDEGSGSTIIDSSGFGHTGTFKGSPLPSFSSDVPGGLPTNQAPVANVGGPYSGTVGAAVQFNGSGSFDPDGTIVSYQWNFGDSTSGAGTMPAHTYTAAGTYNVTLTVTDNGGATASATTTATIANSGGTATATFVRTDTTTQGSWKTRYGSDGYQVVNDSVSYPAYALVSLTGHSLFTWAASTSDWRALQKAASSTDRIAATMYSPGTFTINVNLTDGQSHQLALYCLDWDINGRQQRIDIRDASNNSLLDSRTVTSFSLGQYLIWTLRGNLKIDVTNLAGANAVISGLFFDPSNTPPPTPPRGAFNGPHNVPGLTQAEDFDNGAEGVVYHDTTPGNDWGANSYRNTGVDVVLSSDGGSAYVIGNAYATEWVEYTINVSTTQNYDFQARVASGGPGGVFHYEVDGVSKGSISVPDTGSWGTFQTLTLPNVSLTAGQHILRVALDVNGTQQFPAVADFNYFNFVASVVGPPAAPSNLTATTVSSSQISLAWQDNSNNETGFKIERSTDGGLSYSLLATVGANVTTYQSTGLTPSTTYFYRVKATNGQDSAPSNAASATTNPAPGGTNLALGRPTAQSSTATFGSIVASANLAVDGNTDGNFWNGSVTHTFYENYAWWEVDVGSAQIQRVDVWNRTDCCSERLSDYYVFVSNQPFNPSDTPADIIARGVWNQHLTIPAGSPTSIIVNQPGRYVRVQLAGVNSLHMAEVQVWGTAQASTSPVGFWKFDEGSGFVAADSSGNNLTGTLQNGPTWIAGRLNGGLSFDGVNDYVQVGAQSTLMMTNALTASAWIMPTSSTSTRTIVNREGEYDVGLLEGVISWAFSNTNPGWNWVSTGYSPPLFQWTHIAVVYDNGIIKTYANGVLVHTYNGSGSIVDASPPENDFRIGSRQCGFCAEYFQGGIDEVRMYNRPLSAAEVQALANIPGVPPAPPSSLSATAVSSSQINLAWQDNSTDETGFKIERSLDGVNFSLLTTVGMNSTSYQNSGLAANTTYHYRVRANNANGDSAPSNVAAATTPSGNPTNFLLARVDPVNRTGTPGEDLFSGNYNWSLPLVDLPGRSGLDFGLTLVYNSLVWTKSASSIKFDADNGSPAPGFRLGFPVIQSKGTGNGGIPAYLMITSAGARVELRQTSVGVFESMDSSNLQLLEASMTLRTSEGSILTYQLVTGGNFMCVQVKDRNGNFISVSYAGSRISTITDTLGRIFTFNYPSGNLDSITQTWNGTPHTWAQFSYQTVSLVPNFPGLTVTAPGFMVALSSVRLADGSSHAFNYTSLGQASTILHSAPDGHLLAYTSYSTDNSTTDCPRLTARQDFAENWNNNNTVFTLFQVQPFTSGVGTATLADGTQMEETYHTSGFRKGLPSQSRIISGGVAKKTTTTNWTQNDTSLGYPANPRVTDVTTSDDAGNLRKTSFVYTSFNLVSDVLDYAADGATVLRHKQTDYVTDAAYINRRIIGLTRERRLYEGGGTANLVSKVSFDYDWGWPFLQNQGAPVQHDSVNYSDSFVQGRGNVSAVNRFDVNTGQSTQVQMTGYNTTGSPIFVRDAIRNVLTVSYADSFSAGAPAGLTLAYPTTTLDADNFTSTSTYHYDLGVTTKTHDPKGAEMIMEYSDPAGRLTRQTYFDSVNSVSGTYTRLEYLANGTEGRGYTLLDPGVEVFLSIVTDGAGRTIGTVKNLPGSVGGYSAQKFVYDTVGRLRQQSNPTEIAYTLGQAVANWTPAGDDAGGWRFSTQDYDWRNRPTVTSNADGSSRSATYGGCGCAGGEVVTLIDEVGRRRINTFDVLGRPIRTQELREDLSTYRTITNTYNARDQISTVFAQRGNNGPGQTTTMTYDGHGRLKTRKTPIQTSPTNYDYNVDDTIQMVTDPRGATTSYVYNNRHLVTGITYGVPPGSIIPATPAATFSYDQAGNISQMTDGTGQINYDYDTWSRLIRETRFFNELNSGSTPFPLVYAYNLAGQLKKVIDPFGAEINYTYDQAGRLSSVTGPPFGNAGVTQYATDMRYRAWGGLKHLNYGDNPLQLNLTYTLRMQVETLQVQGNKTVPDQLSKEYGYYPDGRLNYSRDLLDSFYSRGYKYDHVGRLLEGLSGPSSPQGVSNGPYDQVYSHDHWDNLTSRQTGDARSFTFNYETATGRNTSWLYDEAGNVTRDEHAPFNRFIFDAAGRQVAQTGPSPKSWVYDGTGRVAKWVLDNETTFNVWSSVLGFVLTELDDVGAKQRTFVYAGRQLIAKQQRNKVFWHHVDSSNASSRDSNVNGAMVRSNEIDPLGAPADFTDTPDPDPDIPEPRVNFNNLSTGCLLDGIDTPCSIVMGLLQSGAAAIAPWNTTRWNPNTNKFEFFKAYADGTSGWSPLGAPNNGAGYQPPSQTTAATSPFATANLTASLDGPVFNAINYPTGTYKCDDKGNCVLVGDDPDDPGPPIQIYAGPLNPLDDPRIRLIIQEALEKFRADQKDPRNFRRPRRHGELRLPKFDFDAWEKTQQAKEQPGYDECISRAANNRMITDLTGGVTLLLTARGARAGKLDSLDTVGGLGLSGFNFFQAKYNFDIAKADCKKQYPHAKDSFTLNIFKWP